jgi:serine protease Do
LKRGDIIIAFNGEKIDEPLDLSLQVGQVKPGTDAKVTILREGEKKDLTIKVGELEQGKQAFKQPNIGGGKADNLGLVVRSISPDDAEKLDVPASFKGVVVVRVEPDTAVAMADVRTDDVILELNNIKIQTIADYEKAVVALKPGDFVRLYIKRGRGSVYLAFKL